MKWKPKTLGFFYSKNPANFDAFCQVVSSSINLLFLKIEYIVVQGTALKDLKVGWLLVLENCLFSCCVWSELIVSATQFLGFNFRFVFNEWLRGGGLFRTFEDTFNMACILYVALIQILYQ